MKRIILLIAVAFGLAISMNAQTMDMNYYRGGLYLGDELLSHEKIEALVGPAIYEETCVGALKQCAVAKKLNRIGIPVAAGGFAAIVAGAATLDMSDTCDVPVGSVLLLDAGILSMVGGLACVFTAIPFRAIGSGRLEWVAENYNQNQRRYSLNLGAQRNGFGVSLTF